MAKRQITEETKETTGGFVDVVGINDNWTLESFGYGGLKKDGSGVPALYFNFKNGPIGVRVAEWDIDEKKIAEYNQKNVADGKSKLTNEEAVQKEMNVQDGRIAQITRCFLDKSEAAFSGDSFEELSNNIVNALKSKGKNKDSKIRLKTIYKNDGNIAVSMKNGRFIQLASEPNNLVLNDWEAGEIAKNKKSATPNAEVKTTPAGSEW